MYNNKRFLAIIPARSGSKGLPDKNIKEMNNKPLIAYTIEACIRAQVFDEILVSTDSIQYADIARKYGASIPFIRPQYLSSDTAATYDVILHVIHQLETLGRTYDYFMLLQPTSPLRDEKDILQSIEILFNNSANSVVSICEVEHPVQLMVKLNDKGRLDFCFNDKKQMRRQDSLQQFRINGAIYLCSINYFLKHKSFYGERSYPYMMNKIASIDIDDMDQFEIAEALLKKSF